jgi:hypothetical protein
MSLFEYSSKSPRPWRRSSFLHGRNGSIAKQYSRRRSDCCECIPEHINESYVARVLRLTLLAPDVVEAILDGLQPPEITLGLMMRPFAVTWTEQRKTLIGWLPRSLACLDAMP